MSIEDRDPAASPPVEQGDVQEPRDSYSPPQLVYLGNLKDVLAGGTSEPPDGPAQEPRG